MMLKHNPGEPSVLTVLGLEMLLQRVHAGHLFGAIHAYVLIRRFRRRRTFIRAPGVRRQLLAEVMRGRVVLKTKKHRP